MKNLENIDDLAIFGGQPAFSDVLHVGRPNMGNKDRFIDRINGIYQRRWLTNNGPLVKEFENRIADYSGVKHCVAMCNGTVALEIAVRALELSGEVIVPSFTFIATAHCLQWQEITPVFCDIDPKTHTIDPEQVNRLVTPRTSGIIGVHLWGQPCAINELQAIADQQGLQLMFDASHAFGCTYKEQSIGNFGRVEVFSFHATKFLNAFEGGAVVTNDDELASKIRLMKNFGFHGLDNVVYIGTNGKMSEISAAMGLTSLESIENIISQNRSNYITYNKHLSGLCGIRFFSYDESEYSNYQYIVIEVDERETRITRDTFIAILHAENVRARRYFFPGCHRMEPYKSYYPNAGLLLKETEILSEKVICLPTGTIVNYDDVNQICNIIDFSLNHANEINNSLGLKGSSERTCCPEA